MVREQTLKHAMQRLDKNMFYCVTGLCAVTGASYRQQLQAFIGDEEWKQTDS